jgi:hypothetical protein
MSTEIDVAAWARTHKAAFEVTPLMEMHGSERVQIGFTVDFYALLPMDKAPGDERRELGMAMWKQLRTILDQAVGQREQGGQARVEVEPMRVAAVMRPENEMQPEVNLRARVFHAADYFASVSPADRDRLSVFEKKLSTMGLRAGHW